MNESKHTPGPWQVTDEDVRGNDIYYRIEAEGFGMVALVDATPVDDDSLRANARLIAAAPDLLDACKIALQAINECDMEVGLFNVTEQEITDKLYAAIAQAKDV